MFPPELVLEIEKEVNKLIDAGFIREVKYPTWIANIVPVRKKNGQLAFAWTFGTSTKPVQKMIFHCRLQSS